MRKRHFLFLGFLALLVTGYHLNNLRPEGYPKLARALRFRPWPHLERGGTRNFDLSAGWLKGIGYLTRFRLGQESEIVTHVARSSPTYLYDRRDKPFFYSESAELMKAKYVAPVRQLVDDLKRQGVELVILPVPPKQSIERARIPASLPVEDLYVYKKYTESENPRRTYEVVLDTDRLRTVDLYRIYESQVSGGGDSPYIPWDLHWNSLGIALAAEGVLANLKTRGYRFAETERVPLGEKGIDETHRLLNLYQLPEFYRATAPELNWKESLFRVQYKSPASLRQLSSPTPKRLIMAGSSFCGRWKDTSHGLGPTLAGLLNRTLVDYCVSGGGFSGAWQHIVHDGFRFFPGDLVVWELILPAFFEGEILPTSRS